MPYKSADARRQYQARWMAARRLEWERRQSCALCGRKYPEVRISPHHRQPEAKDTHRVWSLREDRRAAELAKCTPLCAECHEAYHRGLSMQTQHGTAGMYRRGCGCPECRAWNAQRVRVARSRSQSSPTV